MRIFTLLLLTLFSLSSHSIEITSFNDTNTHAKYPDTNYDGDSKGIRIRSWGPASGFIMFSSSQFTNQVIESAVMELEIIDAKKLGTLSLHLPDSHWTEQTLTFNNQPAFSEPLLEIPVTRTGTLTVDITDLVQSWADRSIPNYGIVLTSDSININIGASEQRVGATLQLVIGGTPNITRVTVPDDYETIGAAMNGITTRKWCPEGTPDCTVVVGPGVFGDLNGISTDSKITIAGAGVGVTVIANLNAEDTGPLAVKNATFSSLINVSNGSSLDLLNITTPRITVGPSAHLLLENSNVSELNSQEGRLNLVRSTIDSLSISYDQPANYISHSVVTSLDLFDTHGVVTNSIIGEIYSTGSLLRIRNSNISNDVFSDYKLIIINSNVEGGIVLDNPLETVCRSVVNGNGYFFEDDCDGLIIQD